ncbi:helix-turn-helix domain-containing protein [Saccharicrinis sp. FJH62]|uniref:helix-turn-helix domain-containing protein n=1 Tax=Saccharicrinis sp. FJH62 TaxID=3344657 RepID=UPI0035D3D8D0
MSNSFVLIEEKTVNELFNEIKNLNQKIDSELKTKVGGLSEKWLDNQDVMLELKISQRTLQNMRHTKMLPYSKVGGKVYYKSTDVERLLSENYTNRGRSG